MSSYASKGNKEEIKSGLRVRFLKKDGSFNRSSNEDSKTQPSEMKAKAKIN